MLRSNSRLHRTLGPSGVDFLEFASGAIERILPHVQLTHWDEDTWAEPKCVWTSSQRTAIRITVSIGARDEENARSLTAEISRRQVPAIGRIGPRVLDTREHDICKRIELRLHEVLRNTDLDTNTASIRAIRDAFDEYIVAKHVQKYHGLDMQVDAVFDALHMLSEQTYENKSFTFGCILDPNWEGTNVESPFPADLLKSKKYKALSDGFRTAYHISTNGQVLNFVDLERFETAPLTEKHFYPEWAEAIARASRHGRCGISLSRQGDILVFDEGSLRLTYRYGKWQYWNHAHLLDLLRDRARAQRVPRQLLGRVVGAIYRAALDVSFRRSGGLFVILHNRNSLRDVTRAGDAVNDSARDAADRQFDDVVRDQTIQGLPRAVVVELASLDGAIVLDNSGQLLAYGAVLQPKRSGRLHGTEGSRTKAAIGASMYGLAIKISSDGDITVYHNGREFIRI